MFFNLPNYGFSICSCHCKLHCESLSQFFFFFLVMSIKNTPQGPLLCSTCTLLPFLWLPHSCLGFLPKSGFLEPAEASASLGSLPGDRWDSSTIAVGTGQPAISKPSSPGHPRRSVTPRGPSAPEDWRYRGRDAALDPVALASTTCGRG